MKNLYGNRCVYCGSLPASLSQDHVTPLIKGGGHTWNNIVPSCRSCNSKKHVGSPPPFLCERIEKPDEIGASLCV
ncbi:MAG: HNH endonuclease [Thermoplasmata archaeon]